MVHTWFPGDKIHFQGMKFYAYHGLYAEEQRLGQRFEVDLTIYLDLEKAGQSDRIEDTVNYAQIYKAVADIMQGRSRKLLEALAEEIAEQILESFPVEALTVCVRKPDPPIPGHYDYVAVEISREVRR